MSISSDPSKLHNISDLYDRGDIKSHNLVEGICIKSPNILADCHKTFLTKEPYCKPSKVIDMQNFKICVLLNMTNIIVKSYTVLYMCLKEIMCQYDWSPEMFIISQTTRI